MPWVNKQPEDFTCPDCDLFCCQEKPGEIILFYCPQCSRVYCPLEQKWEEEETGKLCPECGRALKKKEVEFSGLGPSILLYCPHCLTKEQEDGKTNEPEESKEDS